MAEPNPFKRPDGGDAEMSGRPGPVETYYQGLNSPEEHAQSMAQALAEHAQWMVENDAKKQASLRLDLAARFMAAGLRQLGVETYAARQGAEEMSEAAMHYADSLLARWKETTPTSEAALERWTPETAAAARERVAEGYGRIVHSDSEGGEA